MLLDTLKVLGQTTVEILRTRLEILSLDAKEAQLRLVSWLILFSISFFFMISGIILGVIWLLTTFWESNHILILGILTGGFLLLGLIILLVLLWKMNHSPVLFTGFLNEQEKDLELFSLSKGSQNDQ